MRADGNEIQTSLRIIISTQADGFAVMGVGVECHPARPMMPDVGAKNLLPLRIINPHFAAHQLG